MLDGLIISVDAMGGDDAPDIVIHGIEYFLKHAGKGRHARFIIHGDEAQLTPLLAKTPKTRERSEVHHTDSIIAMDAKVQVDFNPEVVSRYRLVGFENRDIADEDFRDDTVDAVFVGANEIRQRLDTNVVTAKPSDIEALGREVGFFQHRSVYI